MILSGTSALGVIGTGMENRVAMYMNVNMCLYPCAGVGFIGPIVSLDRICPRIVVRLYISVCIAQLYCCHMHMLRM